MGRVERNNESIYGGITMNKLRNHIDNLFKDVPINEKTESIKQEIIQNLEEKVLYLMEHGKTEEDAMNKAIVEFGDVEDLKKELGVYNVHHDTIGLKKAKNNFYFSICGSILLISLFVFINLYYTPSTVWFIYPTFGILWWPLSMFFVWSRKK